MERYRKVVRALFAVIFIAGGIAHLVLGRVNPEGYVVFADTAMLPIMSDLWMAFVMPNIGWLTIVLGFYEFACGIGMVRRRTVAIAAWGMACLSYLHYGIGIRATSGVHRRRSPEEPPDHYRDGGHAYTASDSAELDEFRPRRKA
ncbi:hypothetical protein [Auritidibacter sp. NML120636]|uniref:hypothetical protein n=1 Tax=Auritidibacter sp. NML120636 TaxID=2170743 RepID=UPI0018F22B83|nr:hypothetical protein [Auritidibacter sp. NML120636]